MEVESVSIRLGEGDTINISIPEEDVDRAPYIKVDVSSDGIVTVHNDEEERIYHLLKTKHGGWELKEGDPWKK